MDYQTQPQPTTDLFQSDPVVFGTFWERFAAAFIDGIILIVPSFFISVFWNTTSGDFVSIVIGWLYSALLESGEGQATLGKKALGLKVTTLDGGRITFLQATGRHFGKIISALILLIGYFMMLWDEKKQALHDKMAGTLVVKK